MQRILYLAIVFGVISNSQPGYTMQSKILENVNNINNRSQNLAEITECIMEARETLKYLKESRVINTNNHIVIQKYRQLYNITNQLIDHAANINIIGA